MSPKQLLADRYVFDPSDYFFKDAFRVLSLVDAGKFGSALKICRRFNLDVNLIVGKSVRGISSSF